MRTLGTIMTIPLLIIFTWRIIAMVSFDIDCAGYIKRSADANTVEMAKSQLEIVIKYCDNHYLTTGYCSIFLKQPCNDVGFWYNNIKNSYNELCLISPTATQLEKTNVLMKLRGRNRTTVTMPNGISIYPNNKLFFWLCLLFFAIAIGGMIIFIRDIE